MNEFARIFKYILPQWPRIITVVISALIVAALLSLSFMTVIPLLKVMMGEEGLHSWVDRKVCDWRYDVQFYVPDVMDFTQSSDRDIAYYLLITDVEKGGLAEGAGLQPGDRIVGAGNLLLSPQLETVPSAELLTELAEAPEEAVITIQLKRLDNSGVLQDKKLLLNTNLTASNNTGAESAVKGVAVDFAKWAVGFMPKEKTRENKTKAVIFIILVMGAVTIVRCVAKFYQNYTAEKIVQIGLTHIRQDAFAHVMDMPVGFFDREKPSDTVSRLIRDTGTMGKALKILLGKALREPLNALCMLAAAMWLNFQLTLIFLCGAPLTIGLVMVFGKKMKRATTKSLMAWSQMLSKLQETLAGLKIVKVYNHQHYERVNFRVINKRLLKQLLKISKVDAATRPVMEIVGMAAGSAALIVGAHWVINQEKMDGSEFLGLLLLLGAAAEAVRKTSDIWNKVQEANAASERVFAVLDQTTEIEAADAVELPPLKNRIEFRNIVFTYTGSDTTVLKEINLDVRAGQNVALVGPNGSGKTTLVNLLPRFYDIDSGSILIDGQDISRVTLSSLRSQIGMVTQNVVTFNDTIAANIAYGNPDSTTEQIIDAAKRSFAHEFIAPLPDGYDTVIGEQGTGLSGGQLQRIVIARAILKNPPILIFDEATSQVDADSEAKIHRAIEEIMFNRTTFIIAHRFSTIVNADVIVVMDGGKIIAQGRHDQLIQTCPLYQSLCETQLVRT
jgi:ABC-type multidrug transport system fused ATPase/permease subunit